MTTINRASALIMGLTTREVSELYSTVNNRGAGFAVGQDGQSLDAAAAEDGWSIVRRVGTGNDQILVIEREDEVALLGDAHGPWAVPVESGDLKWPTSDDDQD